PCAPAVRVTGALPIVPFGRAMVAATACDVLRPLLHVENGKNPAAGTLVPLRVTLSVASSNVHAASSRRLTVPLVTRAAPGGVGAMKRSGPGFGKAKAGGAVATIRKIVPPNSKERMPNLPPVGSHAAWSCRSSQGGRTDLAPHRRIRAIRQSGISDFSGGAGDAIARGGARSVQSTRNAPPSGGQVRPRRRLRCGSRPN